MKYRVTTTTADHDNGHTYGSARAALTVYNNIRAIYARAGYTIADAGTGHNSRAELWTKESRADRNIEIWPVTDEDTTTAAEVISESEPTARPAAGSLAAKVATAARVFLLACCLSAADGLTAAPAADDLTPCELLTADPLAEVIRLQAAGLTVSHVTIKSTTPAAC